VSELHIGNLPVGVDYPPLLVAEMSGNHNQSLQRALDIVDAAAESGAHAVKLQTYTADTMTLDVEAPGFTIDDAGSPWFGRRLYDLYAEAHTPWEWHAPIVERCRERDLLCFSAPFDETAVEFLETFDMPCYKIASFENGHLPLIRAAAATGRPLVVSTGTATLAEIDEAVETARGAGCRHLLLLHCVSGYPARPEDMHLRTVPFLRNRYGCEVGLSDHTLDSAVAVAAVSMGAALVEKHFTLRRSDGGVDSTFSLEPPEFAALRLEIEVGWRALGRSEGGFAVSDQASRALRRSLYVAQDMRAGDEITRLNVRVVRPGLGLEPRHYEAVLGKHARRDVRRGTPVTWDLIQ
jgi:pseudaminic acid synthase